MSRCLKIAICLFCGFISLAIRVEAASPTAVFCVKDASPMEKLAGKEVRRYVYQRTGTLLPISNDLKDHADGGLIILGAKDQPVIQALLTNPKLKTAVDSLAAEQYMLKTIQHNGRPMLLVVGGDPTGTLYGAYAFAEKLGVRFYLHGDVIPDGLIAMAIPNLDETHRPLFPLRGLQPFHDFPEGPDWWTTEDWKAFVSQTAKMRMNFVGLHTYPNSNHDLGPEPTVWIGLPQDCNPDGTVKISDSTSWHNTQRYTAYGCYRPEKTGAFSFGGAEVFPSDDYGSELNGPSDFPFPKTPEASVALMNRTGKMLKEIFDSSHQLGIKTCVGTESPLSIPEAIKSRLKEQGMKPDDPAVLQKLYEGMFLRIQRAYPIDYYWIWGHEGEIDQNRFLLNVQCALAAAKETKAPFGMGICGWGWITSNFPTLDKVLPKNVVFSAISMSVGNDPVSPNFGKLEGRPRWAIPWFEDDSALISPQLWVGRMRRDAAAALGYGCSGLMGLHWRTRALSPNLSAIAQAAWHQESMPQFLAITGFYEDWATAQFGAEVAKPVAQIFSQLDGHHPRPSGWNNGPGVISVNGAPWETVSKQYDFVEDLAALRAKVRGAGNLERFDWWLNTWRYTKAMARVGCVRGALDAVMQQIAKEADSQTQRRLAQEKALPLRKQLVQHLGEMYGYLLATLNNATELGTIANVEQQSLLRTQLLTVHDDCLKQLLGAPLPPETQPWKDYRGPARLVVMTARGSAAKGESLPLKIIAIDKQPVASILVRVRPLGGDVWQTVPAAHLARSVFQAQLPAAQDDFEYCVVAESADGKTLHWPATAPAVNQTVIVVE